MKSMVTLFGIIVFAAMVGFTFVACDNGTTAENVAVTGVSLNRTAQIGRVIGMTYDNLTATVEPANATDQRVTWSSSDPAIATVSSTGVITAVSVGTARITVTTVDGGFSAFVYVAVTSGVVYVTGVTLSPSTVSRYVGETVQLTVEINPDNATFQGVTWDSSTAMATVLSTGTDTAEVTAVSVGSAIITVTTDCGGHTATANVTVNPRLVTGVTLNYDRVDLRRTYGLYNGNGATPTATVGETLQLKDVVITPVNATDLRVNWSSSNPAIATVSPTTGLVTAVAVGSATITVTTVCGGYTDTVNVYVHRLNFNHYKWNGTNNIRIHDMSGTVRDLVIPETINDAPVEIISAFAFNNRSLRSVVIPANVDIGSNAFQNNSTLISVTIGADVKLPSPCTFPWGAAGGTNILEMYENHGRVAGTFERVPGGPWQWYPLNP